MNMHHRKDSFHNDMGNVIEVAVPPLSMTHYDIPRYLIGTKFCELKSHCALDVTTVILRAIRTDLADGAPAPYDNLIQSMLYNVFVASRLSHSVLLAGLLYLLRFRYLLIKHRKMLRRQLDVHSPSLMFVLFLASITLASKFHLDSTIYNRRWSETSGISTSTINRAEAMILEVIEFKLTINKDTFNDWVAFLFKAEKMQAYRRNLPRESLKKRDGLLSISNLLGELEAEPRSTVQRIIA